MARIFTTSFEFNEQRYDAIVTVISRGDEVNFNVKLLGADFDHLFPNGEIAYSGTNGYEQLEIINNALAQPIMHSIGAAINKHLVVTP